MTEITIGELLKSNFSNPLVVDEKALFFTKLDNFTKQLPWEDIDNLVWLLIKDHMSPYLQRHKLPITLIETRDLYELLDLLTPEDELLEISESGIGADRNRLTVRLMMTLLFLEFEYPKFIQDIFQEWPHNMHYQHFSGIESFEAGRQPCHEIQLIKFRHLLSSSYLYELMLTMSEFTEYIDWGWWNTFKHQARSIPIVLLNDFPHLWAFNPVSPDPVVKCPRFVELIIKK